jgi:hypothetical protein
VAGGVKLLTATRGLRLLADLAWVTRKLRAVRHQIGADQFTAANGTLAAERGVAPPSTGDGGAHKGTPIIGRPQAQDAAANLICRNQEKRTSLLPALEIAHGNHRGGVKSMHSPQRRRTPNQRPSCAGNGSLSRSPPP